MVTTTDALAPLANTDLDLGGRWTSLRVGGREWLWQRDEPARGSVNPGDPFVDAGGLEECIPTVRGAPDHGLAWSRPWHRADGGDTVDCGDFVLTRRLATTDSGVAADYRLTAQPGYRFVWAAHALLDLGVGATISLPDGAPARLIVFVAADVTNGGIAGVATGVEQAARAIGWPVRVIDGESRLVMRVEAECEVPISIALWRNLGGYPPGAAYRSVGIEPMLGTVFDLADAGSGDAAVVPPSGSLRWRLHITGSSQSSS